MLTPGDIAQFRSLVARRLGLEFDDGKLGFLTEVLDRRLSALRLELPAYEDLLAHDAAEVSALAEQLTVGETYFFRNIDQFHAFVDVALAARAQAMSAFKSLRVLSAGCSSGDEAYTLAMLIHERLPDRASWDVRITGVDLNPRALEKARRARYPAWSLRETPQGARERWFRAEKSEFVLDRQIASAVTFRQGNLAEDDALLWAPGTLDVVFCRNVSMYFPREVAARVIARISRALVPGGFLFLGHAENLRGLSQDFHLRHTHGTFYYQRKTEEELARDEPHEGAALEFPQTARPREATPTPLPPDTSWFEAIQHASQRIADLTQRTPAPRIPPRATFDRTQALELLRTERFRDVVELVRADRAIDTDPDALLLLAVSLTNTGHLADAEAACRRLLALDELHAGAHYLLALGHEHNGQLEAAQQADQVAVYLDPEFAMPRLHAGLVARRKGDLDAARRELTQALSLLDHEDSSRILLFGGGFTRDALSALCRAELAACGAPR